MTIIRFAEAENKRPDDPELKPDETAIWKYPKEHSTDPEKVIFWKLVKKVKNTSADEWLTLLRKDDPDFEYKISKRCPI